MVTSSVTGLRLVFIFAVTLCCITNACETCSNPWKKVYKHDDKGKVVSGKYEDLVNAHRQGAKIRYSASINEGSFEELDYSFTLSDSMCGQSVMHLVKNTWEEFLVEGQWRFVLLCTDGVYEEYKYSLGEPVSKGYKKSNVGITWFVRESNCLNPIYSHKKDGTVVSGNKDGLKVSVRYGFDVVCHLPDYGLSIPTQNVLFQGGEVVAQNIRSVYFPNSDEGQWWFEMVSTDGLDANQLWNLGEHKKKEFTNQSPIEWYVEPCWRHAYTHDGEGNELDGTLADLVAAVGRGQRVKIVMDGLSIEADNLRIKGGEVTAQLIGNVGMTKTRTFVKNNFWIWRLACTTGTVSKRKYGIGNTVNKGDKKEQKTIAWFVDSRRWQKVLTTDDAGAVTFGSKASLKEAIENGAPVRVGIKYGAADTSPWLYYKAEILELTADGEIAAELIKSLGTQTDGDTEYKFTDTAKWRFLIVTTQSNVYISKWNVGEHVSVGNFGKALNSVSWFVNH